MSHNVGKVMKFFLSPQKTNLNTKFNVDVDSVEKRKQFMKNKF